MELSAFIKETLGSIISGVEGAQGAVDLDSSAAIVPELEEYGEHGVLQAQQRKASTGVHQVVDFHVALTNTDATGGKGGLGVFLAGIGVGAQAETQAEHVSLTRIDFSIPIRLPNQPDGATRDRIQHGP